MNIRTTKRNDFCYDITYDNGVSLGELEQGVDGYYYWWPVHPSTDGCYPSHVLLSIANALVALNAAWDREVQQIFSEQ